MANTTIAASEGLKIPVFTMAQDGQVELAVEPFILRHSILEAAFSADELQSLAIAKLALTPEERQELKIQELGELLKHKLFPDGVVRGIAFSSGDTCYFTDKTLKHQIADLFKTEPDAACRYGSLLTSDCLNGTIPLEQIRMKLVDYTDPQDTAYRTGDCHGKISPQLAAQLGADPNAPFQFRFAWRTAWATETDTDAPTTSFLAKGTLLVDSSVTEAEGYDLILDRSSIKGVNKSQLSTLIPCGDYELPQVVMGNRSNAKITEYDNNWQFTIWFSEKAVLQDFGPPTLAAAQQLAAIQRDPVHLARHIVDQHDQQQAYHALQHEQEDTEAENKHPHDSRMVALLRADRYGQLLESPKVAEFMRQYVAQSWRDLAIKTGFKHSSAMAMPAPELERGVICAPHLPEGDMVVTRYPIISRDNIRIYHNTHSPELFHQSEQLGFHVDATRLMQTQNVVWINPKDAEDYHQADFDGDQLLVTPAHWMPAIAKEIRRAEKGQDFETIQQRPKQAYTDFIDEHGRCRYTLPMIAVASSQNKVGMIAKAIGQVQSSTPATGEDLEPFEYDQRKLLNRLFAALQIEVDAQKSAERHEDVKEIGGQRLLKDVKQWNKQHPCHFFEFYKHPETYRNYALPTTAPGSGAVNVVPREIINPIWEAVQIPERSRDEFRHLFPKPDISDARWQKYLDWADGLKSRFRTAITDITHELGKNPVSSDFAKRLGQVYESYRNEVTERFRTPEQRLLAATALWQSQHSRPELSKPQKQCQAIAQNLPITFESNPQYQVPTEAIPRKADVLRVPFGNGNPEQDRVIRTKEKLDELGILYDAVTNSKYPVIDFVLKPLEQQPQNPEYVQSSIDRLRTKFKDNVIEPDQIPHNLWVVTPPSYTFAQSQTRPGSGALVYNLFTEEIAQQLQQMQIKQIEVLGIKFNEFMDESFNSDQWQQPVTVTVDRLKLNQDDPNYYRYHGTPALAIDGKILGTFAPTTVKLPIGSTFEARVERLGEAQCLLHVAPESVQLPEMPESNSRSLPKPSHDPQYITLGVQQNLMATSSAQPNFDADYQQKITRALMTGVADMYKEFNPNRSAHFKLDDLLPWNAQVNPDGEVWVEEKCSDETDKVIAQFNIHSGEIYQVLSPERTEMFIKGGQKYHHNKATMATRQSLYQESIKSQPEVN